jgi:hypothetical protein
VGAQRHWRIEGEAGSPRLFEDVLGHHPRRSAHGEERMRRELGFFSLKTTVCGSGADPGDVDAAQARSEAVGLHGVWIV